MRIIVCCIFQALEAGLVTYNGLVKDLRKKADKLAEIDPEGAQDINKRQVGLVHYIVDQYTVAPAQMLVLSDFVIFI